MRIRSILRALIILCLAAPALAGCNTIAGVGRDISAIGGTVTTAATGTQQGVARGFNEATYAPAAGYAGASDAVYFGSGSAQLTPEGREVIRIAANTARDRNVSTVRVAGYADTVGSSELNERLSQRRAQAVAAELVEHGIPQDRIVVDWFGERDLPIATGDGMPEAQNRIVTISL
jgi:outer membrane protein OmpA-like peptidoglycan-associated protein